jgi:hypothetical protein
VGQRPVALAIIDGKPAVAYRDLTDDRLRFAIHDGTDTGDGSADFDSTHWTAVTVDAAVGAGYAASLASVNGRPAIAYCGGVGHDILKCAVHDGTRTGDDAADYDASHWVVSMLEGGCPGGDDFCCPIVDVDGKPAIAYSGNAGGAGSNEDLRFAVNLNGDGTGPWSITTLDSDPAFLIREGSVSLAVVEGKPAVTYLRGLPVELWVFLSP